MVLAPAVRVALALLVIAACTTLVSRAGKSHVEGTQQQGRRLSAEHACGRWIAWLCSFNLAYQVYGCAWQLAQPASIQGRGVRFTFSVHSAPLTLPPFLHLHIHLQCGGNRQCSSSAQS